MLFEFLLLFILSTVCVCVFCVHIILYVLMHNMTDVQHVCGTLR